MLVDQKEELIQRIETALNDLRPHLAVDGGDIELVDITDDFEVRVKWLGNCEMCTMSSMTMRAGVEQTLKQYIPEITSVVAINGI